MSKSIKPKVQQLGRHSRVLLFAVLLASALRSVGLSIVDLGLPSFIIELESSLISYGIVIGIFSIMQSIFQFPIAAASDRFGRRMIALIAMCVYIIGTFLCFFAYSIIQLILFRAIQGVGAYTSILQAIVGDIYGKEQHGKGMGLYSLSFNIGYFGGIILGGYIASYLGFRHIFSISGFLILFSTIFLMIIFKNNKNANIEQNEDQTTQENKSTSTLNKENIFELIKHPQFNLTIIINSLRWFLFGGIVAYLIWVFQEYYGIDEITTSYILILIVLIYVGFVFLSSKIIDKQGAKRMILIGQIIALAFGFWFFFEFAKILVIFITLSIAIGIGLALYDPAGNTILLDKIVKVDENLKGTGIGFNNTIGFFSGALGPIFICWLGEYDVFYPFYLIFALIAVAFILTWIFIKE
ncbi:MAG: membrane protein of unknown function [Promethearchaeota archaeon]|nr:MAG: membrane protein of unknown function [Candidatus Lokiarchaeota archaeon]